MASRPRGTRDFAPAEMARRRAAEATLRGVFGRFGYREIQTPVFEELELFTAKSGDGIISELYDFTDKGDRRMTLRPELTAPAMRMYFADHAFDPKPIKWCYFGACYRYDRPQEGRYREFWQFGCEQIGAGTPLAYAELIALGASCFEAMGLKDIEFRVGHVGILRGAVERLGLDDDARAAAMRLIDKRDLDGLHGHLAGADKEAVHDLFTLLEATDLEGLEGEAADELGQTLACLADFGVDVTVDLGIARGLDYYTGIVFEAHCQELEAQSQLLGGGGYDLSHVFGGQPTPTMGFGLGFDRALVALEKQGHDAGAAPGPAVLFGALSDAARGVVVRHVAALRRGGLDVELDLLGRKPGQIAKHADAVGAQFLVLVGDRDLEQGQVQVKSLHDGERHDVALAELEAWLVARA